MDSRRLEQGFTLLEILTALAILIIGVTSLLGALSLGLETRRGAEQRSRAVLLADQVIQDLRSRGTVSAASPVDLSIDAIAVTNIDGFPGMKYSVQFVTEPEHPNLLLARIRISWNRQGSDVGIEFMHLLPRSIPLSKRVELRLEARRRSP